MAITNYTITLEFTARGKDTPPHSTPQSRHQKAIKAANNNNVTGWNGLTLTDGRPDRTESSGQVIWKVRGELSDVCKMIDQWTRPHGSNPPNVKLMTAVDDAGNPLNC
jgi:hypothetical protein